MEITGKIIFALPEMSGTSKAGNPWKKREYVLETQETYPKKVHFDFFCERADQYPLAVGDTVKIIGTGNGSSYGKSNTAYGIGWTRQILKIWDGRPYPYQVGNNTGTTGFYKAEALQKK